MKKIVLHAGLADKIFIDSAGTSAYHVGEAADARSRETAAKHGYQLTSRSRKIHPQDLATFDYIVAMDQSNYQNILQICTTTQEREKVSLLRNFDPTSPKDASVPDPYYGGDRGFIDVLNICIRGCEGLLKHIQERDLHA